MDVFIGEQISVGEDERSRMERRMGMAFLPVLDRPRPYIDNQHHR